MFRSQSQSINHSPVYSDGHEREHTDGYREGRDEEVDLAVLETKEPDLVHVEGQVERNVKDGDEDIGDRQIHQEVVRHRAHALVRENNPDDDDVSPGGHHEHDDEQGVEDGLLPPGQDVADALHRLIAAHTALVAGRQETAARGVTVTEVIIGRDRPARVD